MAYDGDLTQPVVNGSSTSLFRGAFMESGARSTDDEIKVYFVLSPFLFLFSYVLRVRKELSEIALIEIHKLPNLLLQKQLS